MNKEAAYNAYAPQLMEQLPKGVFLTTQYKGKTNTMTIGWGSVGFIWKKPVFTVLVRHSRYTHELLEKSGEFTVSVPFGKMSSELSLCGTKSGRDIDKIAAAGLATIAGQKLGTPVIKGCDLHYECKIVAKQEFPAETLDAGINAGCYPNGDYHTMYIGEIVASYLTE